MHFQISGSVLLWNVETLTIHTLRKTSIFLLFLLALSYTSIIRNTKDNTKKFCRVKKSVTAFPFLVLVQEK